ncbi:MAG: hypothetical protein ACTS5F_01770 [Candidatus Hodgkinia cicadicola]
MRERAAFAQLSWGSKLLKAAVRSERNGLITCSFVRLVGSFRVLASLALICPRSVTSAGTRKWNGNNEERKRNFSLSSFELSCNRWTGTLTSRKEVLGR